MMFDKQVMKLACLVLFQVLTTQKKQPIFAARAKDDCTRMKTATNHLQVAH